MDFLVSLESILHLSFEKEEKIRTRAEALGYSLSSAIALSPVDVVISLGERQVPVSFVLRIGRGSVVSLGRSLDSLVNIYVGGALIAEGQIEVDSGKVGVRVVNILF